ncbi:hypothetical protein [Pseudodesulfovibrio karagichevae]|uniref:MAE-28990/MAE-18760-like HEPN domain-containing protein n=1 Tax=Pseudodesulfovibrio karagichevae TaxID=3239305 RepID=A0ABV4K5L4_9BACT
MEEKDQKTLRKHTESILLSMLTFATERRFLQHVSSNDYQDWRDVSDRLSHDSEQVLGFGISTGKKIIAVGEDRDNEYMQSGKLLNPDEIVYALGQDIYADPLQVYLFSILEEYGRYVRRLVKGGDFEITDYWHKGVRSSMDADSADDIREARNGIGGQLGIPSRGLSDELMAGMIRLKKSRNRVAHGVDAHIVEELDIQGYVQQREARLSFEEALDVVAGLILQIYYSASGDRAPMTLYPFEDFEAQYG